MCLIWLLRKYKNCMIVFNPSRKTIELMAIEATRTCARQDTHNCRLEAPCFVVERNFSSLKPSSAGLSTIVKAKSDTLLA